MKTIAQAIKAGNDGKNQSIKSKFVSREVTANVNEMVNYILTKSEGDNDAPFSFDDVLNLYTYPEWQQQLQGELLRFDGGTEEDKETFLEEFERLEAESLELFESNQISSATHDRNLELIQEAKEEFKDLEQEPQDVLEWWLVSEFLCQKLEKLGYPVITSHNIWGRCTSGQAILLDYVITKICADMQILEGQENAWE